VHLSSQKFSIKRIEIKYLKKRLKSFHTQHTDKFSMTLPDIRHGFWEISQCWWE
jgi:hypothetical protein